MILTGSAVLPRNQRGFDHYFNPNVFLLPVTGQIGQHRMRSFYGPGVNNWDIAATKHFRFKERVDAQLRIEMYNTFNHPQWSSVNNTALFDPSTENQVNSALGRITADRGPRLIQLAFRLGF